MAGKKGMRQRDIHGRGDQRQRIWQSIRVLRRFTSSQVVTTCGAGRSNVRKYLCALERAGYLRRVGRSRMGCGFEIIFQLLRDTGPWRPIASKTGDMWDLNLKR